MKVIYIFFILILVIGNSFVRLSGQTQVAYTYDAAGNRLNRTIPLIRSAAISNQEQEEEIAPKEIVFSDIVDQSTIRIYPNPTKGMLKVEVTSISEETPLTVQIYDMGGRLLINEPNVISSLDLNINDQPTGTYILKISSDDSVSNWKIIKQ